MIRISPDGGQNQKNPGKRTGRKREKEKRKKKREEKEEKERKREEKRSKNDPILRPGLLATPRAIAPSEGNNVPGGMWKTVAHLRPARQRSYLFH
jgi:hypothetical protein